jgi:hypothetical protein
MLLADGLNLLLEAKGFKHDSVPLGLERVEEGGNRRRRRRPRSSDVGA